MKYFSSFFIFCFISIFIFYSCKTDFDVNAKWKDITVVYGLLNQNDSLHLIKVNKAFLGNEDAYVMASHSDSINYNNISVSLEQWLNNSLVKTIILDSTTEFKKDTSGIFATDNNIIYKTSEVLDPESEYKLIVNIPGKQPITSTTKLISGLTVNHPFNLNSEQINFGKTPYSVEWKSTANAKLYELTIRFYYYEILNGDTTLHHLDWVQESKISINTDGGEKMTMGISGESFYQFIASKLYPNYDLSFKRVVRKNALDFIFMVGGDDLNTYIEVNRPSNTIVQEKPAFTNISNGIGIFSCRFDKTIKDKELKNSTIDSLHNGRFTKNLQFLDYAETYQLWNTLK